MWTQERSRGQQGLGQEQGGGIGSGYSLHEFTRGPLRAESHEVIHTDDSPRVPVPAQGTCRAKRPGHSDALLRGMPSCPCAGHSPARTTAWGAESKSRAPHAGSALYPLTGDSGQDPSMLVSLWKIQERRQSMWELWEAEVS